MKKKIMYEGLEKPSDNVKKSLENAVIISIEYHEFGHVIIVVLSFIENKLESADRSRKKYLKLRVGGYYLEHALFGKVIKFL